MCNTDDLLAQYRVEGIAPDSIEQLHITRDSLSELSEYPASDSLSTILHTYWENRAAKENSIEVTQNYLLEKLQAFNTRYRSGVDPKSLIPIIEGLENEIRTGVGSDNIIYNKYYNTLGIAYMNVLGDRSKARDIFKKQQENSIKYFGKGSIEEARALVFVGETYRKEANYDDALKTHLEARKIILDKSPNTKIDIESLGSIGVIFYRQHKYREAMRYYKEAGEICAKVGRTVLSKNIIMQINVAECYRKIDLLDSAVVYSEAAVQSAKSLYGNDSKYLIPIYQTYSLTNIYAGNISRATGIIDSAILILHSLNNKRNLSNFYYNRGHLDADLNVQADYFRRAIENCPEDTKCYEGHLTHFYNGLAGNYTARGDYDGAESYYQKAIKVASKSPIDSYNALSLVYTNLAEIAEHKGKHASAVEYLETAIDLREKVNADSYTEALFKSKLALLLQKLDRHDEATSMHEDALAIVESRITNEIRKADTYRQFSKYYSAKKEYDKAIDCIDTSYLSIANNFGKDSYLLNPNLLLKASIYQESNNAVASRALLQRIDSLSGFNLYLDRNAAIPDFQLWKSFSTLIDFVKIEDALKPLDKNEIFERIELGNDLISEVRSQFFFEVSEVDFQKKIDAFYNWALSKLDNLYANDQDQEILEKIFQCIELSKSISLNRNHQRFMAVADSKIPQSWIDKEKDLIYKYQQEYDKYSEMDTFNLESTNELFDLQKEKELFLDSLQSLYPEYYRKRYKQDVTTLAEMKELSRRQENVFVIYHLTDSLLLNLTIGANTSTYNSENRTDLDSNLTSILSLVNDRTAISNETKFKENKAAYIEVAAALYDFLLDDQIISNQTKVTIVPDGGLAELPFDILLAGDADSSLKYADLPYLIKTHTINYVGSATQAVNYDRIKNKDQLESYIGFGPSYNKELIQRDSSGFRGAELLTPLLYNKEEIISAAELFDGEKYVGVEATESVFSEHASGVDILHLAMHAILNDGVPMESYLSFGSGDEVGQLYVHEIAKMNLQNELVVLSACETNKDSYDSGEGVLGIARAFQMAACPNIILSNWLVDDKSASDIMATFFKNIKNQQSPSEALRTAKLEYINGSSAIKSHPSYWAAFSYYGSEGKQAGSFMTTKVSMISFGLLTLLLVFLFFVKPLLRK